MARLLLVLLSLLPSFAQLDQGQIAGTVTDPSREVVSAAQVTIVSAQTGRRISTKTAITGAYVIPNLPIGLYAVEIEAPGFRKFVRENVKVDTATRTSVDAELTLGATSDTITVSDEAPPVQDSSAQLGRVI